MGEDIAECRYIIDFFRESVAQRCYEYEYDIDPTREEPSENTRESIWDDEFPCFIEETRKVIDKPEKYTNCDELGYRCDDKKFFCRVVSLEYPDRDIEAKGNSIRDTEKYPYQGNTLELKSEKKYH